MRDASQSELSATVSSIALATIGFLVVAFMPGARIVGMFMGMAAMVLAGAVLARRPEPQREKSTGAWAGAIIGFCTFTFYWFAA